MGWGEFTKQKSEISDKLKIVCVCVRLQCEVKLQRQQLSDSQHLLQSLRVELQVYEKIKTETQKHKGTPSFLFRTCNTAQIPVVWDKTVWLCNDDKSSQFYRLLVETFPPRLGLCAKLRFLFHPFISTVWHSNSSFMTLLQREKPCSLCLKVFKMSVLWNGHKCDLTFFKDCLVLNKSTGLHFKLRVSGKQREVFTLLLVKVLTV